MRTASGSPFALAAALAAALCAAAIGACSSEYTPHPPEIGGCPAIGDASCKVVAGGAGSGASKEPDSGEAADAPLDVELTDALLACASGTDRTLSAVASISPGCAECLAAGIDAGLTSCCGDALSCSMDDQCQNILNCELTCTSGAICCVGLTPPATSLSTYNVLARCAQTSCGGLCPMLQHLSITD